MPKGMITIYKSNIIIVEKNISIVHEDTFRLSFEGINYVRIHIV